MNLTLRQLKSKWNEEKEHYGKKEVGTGVQKFVKDFLKSEELFGLREGLGSTPKEKRKNEFTEESETKAARRADIIIYINPDIIIPVEVEKYGNIDAGLEQLFQYQTDLDKKYGILTDGFIWQFYNNNYCLKKFSIEEIFAEPDLFLEYWKEYIKPEYYYISFFEDRGQLKMLPEDISVENKRRDFFKDITTLIRGFKNKLQVEGYFSDLEIKERQKRATEITYAYIIQFILYKTLVDNDFGDFRAEHEKRIAKIHQALKNKSYKEILGIINGISSNISRNIYRPFIKEQEFINQKLTDLFNSVENDLSDVAPWLDIFVFIKKYNFANVRNDIFGYIYENYLKELYQEGTQIGQYFTDPAIVNFMLDQIGYTEAEIKKRVGNKPHDYSISLIDPSCGSGTFLYSAVDHLMKAIPDGTVTQSQKVEELVNNNIFGLDIEEFPIYLAEMSILMRLLPLIINERYNNPIDKKIKVFLTKDSVAEFIKAGIDNTVNDIDVAGGRQKSFFDKGVGFDYQSYVRDEGDLAEMKESMRQIPRRRFDFVIGNPPYISYNECSKKNFLIFEKMKKGDNKLSDIYGVNLHSIPGNRKKYSPKPNLYSFFIALGLSLLKDQGRLCYIIPQTILTAGDLDVLRYHLAKFTTIEKIITFSGKMFVGRGLKQNKPIATSSLIFVVRRAKPGITHQVEVINYTNADDDVETCLRNILLGKKISKKKILQGKLLQNVANWNFIKQNKVFLDFEETYKQNSEDMMIYYNHAMAEEKFGERFYFDGSFNIPTKNILPKVDDVSNYWQIPYLKSIGYKLKTDGFYPKDKKIKIAQGSQGMIVLDTKYKIVWHYIKPSKFFFIEGVDVLPKFQQFCIASNDMKEIFYLLILLNSKINSLIINNLLKNENEKDFLIPLNGIKRFVRVPKITKYNQFIKDEIIKRVEEMLELEKFTVADLVDFSKVMMQKFDEAAVEKNYLVLTKGGEKVKCKITGDAELVKKIIQEKFSHDLLKEQKISLTDLQSSAAIDFAKQKELKNYIDDLVFALYFNIPIKKVGLGEAKKIKSECEESKFYKVVENKKDDR